MLFFQSIIQVGRLRTPIWAYIYIYSNKYDCLWRSTAKSPLLLLPSWCTKLGASNWAKKCVRYREIFRGDMISRNQSQKSEKFGMWIQYLDRSYLVISHDMGYDITIYRDISCGITPNHRQTTWAERCHLFGVYRLFWLFVSALFFPECMFLYERIATASGFGLDPNQLIPSSTLPMVSCIFTGSIVSISCDTSSVIGRSTRHPENILVLI